MSDDVDDDDCDHDDDDCDNDHVDDHNDDHTSDLESSHSFKSCWSEYMTSLTTTFLRIKRNIKHKILYSGLKCVHVHLFHLILEI